MIKNFDRDGIQFQYPANWTLDLDEGGNGWTVVLQSPATAFALISLRPDADTPSQVATEALDALKQEYSELEADQAIDNIAGQPAVGHDIEFLTLDTSIICWTRCFESSAGPVLVLCQTSEYDREMNEPVLRAICASIQTED